MLLTFPLWPLQQASLLLKGAIETSHEPWCCARQVCVRNLPDAAVVAMTSWVVCIRLLRHGSCALHPAAGMPMLHCLNW